MRVRIRLLGGWAGLPVPDVGDEAGVFVSDGGWRVVGRRIGSRGRGRGRSGATYAWTILAACSTPVGPGATVLTKGSKPMLKVRS